MSQRTTVGPNADNNRNQRSNRTGSGRSFLAGFFGCGGLLALLVLIGVGIYTFYVIAPVEAQLPDNAVTTLVNLTQPFQDDNVSLTDYNTVRASAVGDNPIQLMQLWVDGVAVDAHAATLDGSFYSTEFSWLPIEPGDHTLMVIAVDVNGQSAISNLVQVKAFPVQPDLVEVPVGEGGTIQSVAEAFDMTPDQVIAINPQVTTPLDQPLPPNTTLTVLPPFGAPAVNSPKPLIPPDTSLLPAAPPPAGPASPAPTLPTNNPIGTFTQLVVAPAATRPAAPQLTAEVDGCTVTLKFTDQASDEVGFLVYRANPGSTTFVKIKALDANSKAGATLSFSEPGRYGRSMYYISAFNGAGESQSLPAQTTVFSQTCVQPDQVGLAVQAPKITTAQPLERAFCYASLDNGPWSRMPKGVETYVYPVNGVFDFSQDLNTLVSPPPTKAVTLSMRCGGFAGDLLIDLGVGQQTIQPNSNNQPFTLSGQGFTLTATLNFGQAQVRTHIPRDNREPLRGTRDPLPEQVVIPPVFDTVVIQPQGATEPTLLWRWRPVTCPPDANGQPPANCKYVNDITGFRVTAYQFFAADPNAKGFELSPDQKLLKLSPLAVDVPVMCYSVVAYKGDLVSDPTQACYGNPNYPTPPLLSANISAPTQFKFTSDTSECQSHQVTKPPVLWGVQDCQLIAVSNPALVWNWKNTLCQPGSPGCEAIADIDGYHIYQVIASQNKLVTTVTPANVTAVVLPPNSNAGIAACYIVHAFKGSLESGPSYETCLSPADLGLNNFRLFPTTIDNFGSYFNRTGCDPETYQQVDTGDKGSTDIRDINVGYIHRTFTSLSGVGNVTGCPQTTAFWREGVVRFDLTTITRAGRTIQKATFEFQRGQAQNLWAADQILPDGFLDMGLATDNDCATSLKTDIRAGLANIVTKNLIGTHSQRNGGGMWTASREVAPAPLGTAPIDVTTLVNELLTAGKSQLSFLFATDESHPDETKSCFSNYHGFKLTIQLAP